MQRLAGLFCLACAASAAAGDEHSSPALTNHPLAPLGTAVPNDLTFDPAFASNGLAIADFNNASGNDDGARRVFPANGGGYWVAGYHRNGIIVNDGIAITKLTEGGTADTTYNGTGRKTLASPLYEIFDVAKGTNDTLFFVGTFEGAGASDFDYGIYCVDSTGTPCAGFGDNGLETFPIDLGSAPQFWDDVPRRIVAFASALYIVGESTTGNSIANENTDVTMIKISQGSGTQDTAFGNTAGRPGLFTYNTVGNAINERVSDLIAYAPAAFQVRLVVVGESQVFAGSVDTDGFIGRVNGFSGAFDSSFAGDGQLIFNYDLGSTLEDGARRVLRLANGRFVVAGYARNTTPEITIDELTLTRFNDNGSFDSSFGTFATLHRNMGSAQNIPFGIVERPTNRDLIVGVNIRDDLFGDGHPVQLHAAFGASGNVLHALNLVDATAIAENQQSSIGADLIIDGVRVIGAGQRRWSDASGDYDFTVARFIPTDSIFAAQFGQATSD